MDSAVPLLLFLAFLFGSILLMLIFGCRDLAARFDDEEEEPLASPSRARPRKLPGFFADLGKGPAPALQSTWSMPWASVEQHLRREHAVASAFVAAPSLQSLFAHTSREQTPTVYQLERHVQDEHRRVSDLIHRFPTRTLYPHTHQLRFVPERHAAPGARASAGLQPDALDDPRAPGVR